MVCGTFLRNTSRPHVCFPHHAVAMALFTPILAENTKEESAGAGHTKMWKAQALLHVPFTALMLYKAFFHQKE